MTFKKPNWRSLLAWLGSAGTVAMLHQILGDHWALRIAFVVGLLLTQFDPNHPNDT